MIISHRHRFVFVKPRKVAGTSIEIALSTACGPDDVITPFALAEDEELRGRLGGRAPQNGRIPLRDLRVRDWASWARRLRRPTPREHAYVPEAMRRTGPRWDEYLKFSIARNPWDKAVSHYFWCLTTGESRAPFSEWLRVFHANGRLTNWPFYALGDEPVLDVILRYEHLDEDFRQLCDRLGIEVPSLPRSKHVQRPSWARDHRVMYDDHDAEFLAMACRNEIAAFGYDFDAIERS